MEQITLNLIPGGIPQICNVSQYDDGRVIRLHLKNGLSDYTLSGTETIRLSVSKSDQTTYVCDVTNTGLSYVDITTVSEMCNVSGESECELTISSGDTVLGTGNFRMMVDPDAFDGDLKIKSVSGPIATFETDLAEDLIKLDVDLEPIQDLHGYDSPWPAGGGINQITVNRTKGNAGAYGPNVTRDWDYTKYYVGFSYNNYYTEENIVSYNVGNDIVSVTQTRNAYGIAFPIGVKPNHQYYVGCTFEGTVKLAASYFDSTGSIIRYDYNMGTSRVITTPDNCSTLVLVVYDGSASGVQVSASDIFINDPATVTEYTPYSNICPISGHDSAQLFRTGKNLLNKESYEWISNSNIIFGGTNTTISGNLILSPGTYTLSCSHNVTGFYVDNNDGVVKRAYNTSSTTFSISSRQAVRINFYIAGVTQSDLLSFNYQLELGSTATPYEPYSSEPTPITVQFGQTVYKGKLDSARRKIIVYFTARAIKTFPWTWYEAEAYPGYFATGNTTDKAYNTNYICECFRSVDKARGFLENGELGVYNLTNGSRRFVIRYDAVSTVEALLEQFGDYLICYELETPIEIDLTQIQTASINSTPVASFETTLVMPLNASEHSFSCSQAEGAPTPDNPIPITGVSEITAIRTGKNLISHEGTMLDQTVYSWGSSDSVLVSYLNRLQPGTYRCSFKCRVLQMQPGKTSGNYGMILRAIRKNGSQFNIQLREMKSNVSVGSVFEFSSTITLTSSEAGLFTNAYYYTGRAYNDGNPDYCEIYDFQIELGSTATEYEPYSGESITVSLGGTYYGGKLVQSEDGSRKIVLSHKKLTFDGTENWQSYPAQNGFYIALESIISDTVNDTISDKFVSVNSYSLYGIRVPAGGERYYFCKITDNISAVTDLASWKTWLSSNNVTVVSKLATPLEIDLPDGDPLTTIVGENNVYCNTGNTALTYYYNMVADPIRIPALVGTNNVYSDAGDVDVEYYTTLDDGGDSE